MYTYSLSDFDSTRNPAPQPGSLADLVGLAQGRPIYCTPSPAALMNVVIGSFHRDCPAAEFVDALALYRNYNWDRRWASERKRFGAAIIVTRAEYLPQGTDPFAGVAGQHVINFRLGVEIKDFTRRRYPVAWHAVVFPASYWLTRFVVGPFNPLFRFRYASPLASRLRRHLSTRDRLVVLLRERLTCPAAKPHPRQRAKRLLNESAFCANAATRSARSLGVQGSRSRTSTTSRLAGAMYRRRAQRRQRSVYPGNVRPSRLSRGKFALSIRWVNSIDRRSGATCAPFRTQGVRAISVNCAAASSARSLKPARVSFGSRLTRLRCTS